MENARPPRAFFFCADVIPENVILKTSFRKTQRDGAGTVSISLPV